MALKPRSNESLAPVGVLLMALAAVLLVALGAGPARAAAGAAASAAAGASGVQADSHPRLLLSAADVQAFRNSWAQTPQFAESLAVTRARLDGYFATPPDVPAPLDAGGGYTHEQHKRNAIAIYDAGLVYQWTGDARYAQWATDLLLAYAGLYPSLGEHPEKKEQSPGRLFWQSLNEAVWLVYVIQGYDAVFASLSDDQRATIESGLLRPLANFLSVESPQTFDKIHNHGTWATAAVGMTGYVIDDPQYVSRALGGLKEDGSAGFLRQLDDLFSPDGYYTEGPYYQRYALMPFIVFAKAIQQNEPQRNIFDHRNGILRKAVYTAVQLSYNGLFFPINDAIKDKGLDTIELDYAITIAWGLTGDTSLLSLIPTDAALVLTGDGLRYAQAVAAGKTTAFPFTSMLLRDGADGQQGALGILRSGTGPGHTALLFKASSQGMGHGHFDRLNWLYYDNGTEVVTDYGAARFLNVVQKYGGHYLPENNTWAKQTVAHNTLVVDGRSHFNGKVAVAERSAPDRIYFATDDHAQVLSAREAQAYPGVEMTRSMLMLSVGDDQAVPLVLDVLRVHSAKNHQYDLPLHFQGQLIDSSHKITSNPTRLEAFGKGSGYQHLWNRGQSRVAAGERHAITWLLGNRFYTHTSVADRDLTLYVTETGATDPEFNLRHEPGLVRRVNGAGNVAFVSLLEGHGEYNGSREFTTNSASSVQALRHHQGDDMDVVDIELADGSSWRVALSYDTDAEQPHQMLIDGKAFSWTGFHTVIRHPGQP